LNNIVEEEEDGKEEVDKKHQESELRESQVR